MWYFVQPRDSISRISQKFVVPLQNLVQANSIANGIIYIGQRLFIPLTSRAAVTYTVKVGDTLGSIAQQFNTTKHAIMQTNNLQNDLIVPGQSLQIETRYENNIIPYYNTPVKGQSVQNSPTDNSIRAVQKYVVQIGDTIESIAAKFNTTKEAIMQENQMAGVAIPAGRTLTITTRSRKIQYPVDQRPESPPAISPYKVVFNSFHDNGLQATLKVWKAVSKKGQDAYFFVSKLEVTAAGSPKAYHQNSNLAYEFLRRAGITGYWWGLVTNSSGTPIVQGANDPAPGYYISKTALSDCSKPVTDPTRYLNAEVIPYIALPARHMMGAKIGDLCLVINTMNNKRSYAIVGDIEPDNSIGIGSIALAEKLGILSSPKTGGVEDGILYIIFAQSGDNACTPKTPQQISEEGERLFEQWGGMKQVETLFKKFPLSYKTNGGDST
ncbi:LysM peptidoglycan-binding domain-containing protein [Peribacillus butanolivorans]|uniref:LysM peptidoglycan-binding domain-containing protein n=1 Tax=Peribacillus butanolivorans TaxID=421767 RepID=UPI00380D045A